MGWAREIYEWLPVLLRLRRKEAPQEALEVLETYTRDLLADAMCEKAALIRNKQPEEVGDWIDKQIEAYGRWHRAIRAALKEVSR